MTRHNRNIKLSGMVGLLVLIFAFLAGARLDTARAAGPWYVSPTGDDGNDCLSWATACRTIAGALGKSSSGDTIYLAAGTYSLSNLLITSRTLIGAGAGSTILDGGGTDRVLQTSGLTTLSGVTVRNGRTSEYDDGGGIFNWSTLTIENSIIEGNQGSSGGAIRSDTILTLRKTIIRDNTATSEGGGIYNRGTLTIENSTISGNTSRRGSGLYNAAVFQSATAALTNVTISGNIATNGAGGIHHYTGTLTILNSTIVNNQDMAGANAAGIAGIYGTVMLTNTIVANSTPTNCFDAGGVILSQGYNLDSGSTCGFTASGDIQNSDPGLDVLANNGGLTPTHALLAGSPAIDAGSNTGCSSQDQRGFPRPKGAACDIGAFEWFEIVGIYLPLISQDS